MTSKISRQYYINGKEAYRQMHDWLVLDHADNAIAMAGFILKNTLSDNGGVTRGVCKVAEGHTHIIDVAETSNIIKTNAYFIENILLFIPFGILLPLGVQQFQSLRFCVAAGAVVSIMTETIQLITQRGHCQMDDVMTNVLGTVIGWTVYRWIRKRSCMQNNG